MGHSHLEDGVDDWILCEMPGDTGDSKRRAGHDEERPTGYPRNLPCVQYRHVQDWKGFVAVTPHGGRIRPNENMTYPAPALVHVIYTTALMASFLLTGWLYIRAKDLADRNPDQRGHVLLTPNRYTLGIAAVLVAWVVGNIVLASIGVDK